MPGTLAPPIYQTVIDSNGNPVVGAKIYTFLAGTSTPADTFTSSTLATPNLNPIIADARGAWSAWLPDTGSFKFVVKTPADVVMYTQDNVASPAVAYAALLTAALANLRDAMIAWPGDEAAGLLGVAYPFNGNPALRWHDRAPGTFLFDVSFSGTVNLEMTLRAEAGATATVSLFEAAAPNTPVVGSTLTSTDPGGELVKVSFVPIVPGTYFFKGHSNHATAQAWAMGYRVTPN